MYSNLKNYTTDLIITFRRCLPDQRQLPCGGAE